MDVLNLVFILFSLIAIALLCFYFYKLAQHDKDEWLKKEVKYAMEEKEAEEWMHTTFVPDVLELIKQQPKKVIKYTFFVLLALVFLWSFALTGLEFAIRNAFYTCVIYVFSILYIYSEPRLFESAKNHLPRKMRHTFNNEWIRAYVFFLLPGAIISFFAFPPFSLLSYLFAYTALFLGLLAATKLSGDIGKEEEKERKHLIKKSLDKDK